MKEAKWAVCAVRPVGHLFSHLHFFLFLWSGFSDLYLFLITFIFFCFFLFLYWFFFVIRILKPKIVEVGLRVSRRLSKSTEKQKAGQMMRHDTRHLDWSFIYIQFLYGSFLKFSTMHWKNCEYFILHFEYSESFWKFIYFEKFNFSLNISNSISGFLKN